MNKKVYLVLRLVIAAILIQTLRFKFTAHPDSVYIFTQVGMEPYGRLGIGVIELIAAVLLLIPRTIWLGAILTAGVLSGAVFFHLTTLGIEVNGDGGGLFYMGLATFILNLVVLWQERQAIPFLGKLF